MSIVFFTIIPDAGSSAFSFSVEERFTILVSSEVAIMDSSAINTGVVNRTAFFQLFFLGDRKSCFQYSRITGKGFTPGPSYHKGRRGVHRWYRHFLQRSP